MSRLPYSEELYRLLRRVNDQVIVRHGCCDVHGPGFAFRAADMTPSFQDLCIEAFHARLLDVCGSEVSLSAAGKERLLEFQSRHNAEVRGVA